MTWWMHLRSLGLAVAALAATIGCASPRGPLVIQVPPSVPAESSGSRDSRAYARVLASITTALEDELEVSVPPFRAVIHHDRESFARGLQSEGQDAALARAATRTMDGIGGPGWVHVYGGALSALPWRARTAMLAHETVHVLQYAWADGRRGASEQWLREGFAEWVTERVMVRLGHLDSREAQRRRALVLRRVSSLERPPLSRLRTFPEWLRWVSATQDAEAYDFAAVAVDALVRRHGVGAVVDYFICFESRGDGDRVFREVFQQSIDEFDAELVASLRPQRRRR